MNKNLVKARHLLETGGYTCVLCNGEQILTDTRRGVRPLLELLESNNTYQEFSAADKVVGKAAAFLYQLLGVKAVYARIISQPALNVLTACDILTEYDSLVSAIRNRDNTGFCPMETAVWDMQDPQSALAAIYRIIK